MSSNWLVAGLVRVLSRRGRRRMAGGRGPAPRLRAEALEDRSVPAVFTVRSVLDNGSADTLRWALEQANATADQDRIVFDLPAGPQAIRLNGTQLTITQSVDIIGPGADRLAVSGDGRSRVFGVNDGIQGVAGMTVGLSGLTVRDGLAGDGHGGGVYAVSSALTVADCVITGNRAALNGGGIYSPTHSSITQAVVLANTTITGNAAGGIGGGLYGTFVTATGCTVAGNTAADDGGGIAAGGTLTGCTVAGNTAGRNGGGIAGGQLTLVGSTVTGNTAAADGGGIHQWPYYYGLALATSAITHNTAGRNGGGVYSEGGLSGGNSTLAGNTAGRDGGGLYHHNSYSGSVLANITVAGNRCDIAGAGGTGGGIRSAASDVYSTLSLHNSIVAGNGRGPAGGPADDVSGLLQTDFSRFNLIGTGGAGGLLDRSLDPLSNNQVGVPDPLLGPLGDYGGPTPTVPLLPGSPAVAGGSRGLARDAAYPPLTTDQRGPGFPRFFNDTVDIGAYQSDLAPARTTLTVTSAADDGPGSLRAALRTNTLAGGANTIAFALPVGATIALTGGELPLIQDITVTGPGADQLAVSGEEVSRIFSVRHAVSATLSGLTIRNGASVNYGTGFDGIGGGVLNEGTLAVNGCRVVDNTAAGAGGGIANWGTLTVTGSSFTGNSSRESSGGGIATSRGPVTIVDSTFAGNSAFADGGGVFGEMSGGRLTVSGSTFAGNTAGRNGGGLFNDSRLGRYDVAVSNSTFTGNTAGWGGGGLYSVNTTTRLANITVARNRAEFGGGIISTFVAARMSNSIVAGNTTTDPAEGPDLRGLVLSFGHNLIGDTTGGRLNIPFYATGDQVGTADSPIDPRLAPLGDYGGPTHTMPPLPGSPALDAGGNTPPPQLSPFFLLLPWLPATDQRGLGRVVNGTIDIGAAEFQGGPDPAADGVSDAVEDAAPNNGDGNADGTPDRLQAHVASLPNAEDGQYVILQSPTGTTLTAVRAVTDPPPGLPANASTPVGTFDFRVEGVTPGGTVTVVLLMPAGVSVNGYWKYGVEPTAPPGTPAHWWNFTFQGGTGAKFQDKNGDGTKDIVLTFVDGGRGDDDGIANGIIVDPGAPVFGALQVEIDVRSTVNLASQGLIAVALFSTDDFDATRVDIGSVLFAGAAAVGWALEDLNGDGRPDLVLHFRTQDTNLRAVYEQLLADDINADGVLDSNHQTAAVSLTGETADAEQFEGSDAVDLFLSGRSLRDLLAALAASGAI